MPEPSGVNASGEPLFHLRRIGPKATKADVVNRMDFYKVTSIIGRNADQVDFLIDSTNHIQRLCISRCHARVVRQPVNQHRLHDDSLNGVFVNNIKIAGSCMLREGDRVTFGHPSGQKLTPGSRARQPDSEHQFLFEKCNCTDVDGKSPNVVHPKQQCDTEFKVPASKEPAGQQKKRERMPTQTFTQEEVKQLKQSWLEMSETKFAESAVGTSDPVEEGKPGAASISKVSEVPFSDEDINTDQADTDIETDLKTTGPAASNTSQKIIESSDTDKAENDTESSAADTEHLPSKEADSSEETVEKSREQDESVQDPGPEATDTSKPDDQTVALLDDKAENNAESCPADTVEGNAEESRELESTDSLENRVEALMQDLVTIRNLVESPGKTDVRNWKSPTKDASIQTNDMNEDPEKVMEAGKVENEKVALNSAYSSSDEGLDDYLSTDYNTEDIHTAATDDKEKVLEKTISTSLSEHPPKSQNESNTKPAIDQDRDSDKNRKTSVEIDQDSDIEEDFECELLPKEETNIEDLNETPDNAGEIDEHSEKAAYMLSDSVEYDYGEDISDPESELAAEVEKRNEIDTSKKHETDNTASDVDSEDSLKTKKDKAEQDHSVGPGDELDEMDTEESSKCTAGSEDMKSETSITDVKIDTHTSLQENKSEVKEHEKETEQFLKAGLEENTVLNTTDEKQNQNLSINQNEVLTTESKHQILDSVANTIENQEDGEFEIVDKSSGNTKDSCTAKRKVYKDADDREDTATKKKCTEMEIVGIQSKDNYDGSGEEKAESLKKSTLKNMIGNIADTVKDFFTHRSSKKSYNLDSANQNYICLHDGTGTYRMLDLQNHEDSVLSETTVDVSSFEKENDSVTSDRNEDSGKEGPKDDQWEDGDETLMEIESTGNKDEDEVIADRKVDDCLEETNGPVSHSTENQENLVEERNDNTDSAKSEDTDLENDINTENSNKLSQDTDSSQTDEGAADVVEVTTGNEFPVVPKTPEKFNESIVFSSQLSSPIVGKVGIEYYTSELQSPIIARQEECYADTASKFTDDEKDDGDDSENDENSDVCEDVDDSSDDVEQLSCNFSDYEDNSYSPPDVDFSMDESCDNVDYIDEDNDEYLELDGEDQDMDDEMSSDVGLEKVRMSGDESNDFSADIENKDGIIVENHTVEVQSNPSDVELVSDNEEDIGTTGEREQIAFGKLPVKRKCDFDDVDSPKKHKSSDDENISSFKSPNASTFKSPVSAHKVRDREQATVDKTDPDEITGTQLMNSSQSLDMSGLTATQMDAIEESLEEKTEDKARSKPSRSKAKDLLAKLRAKKQQRVIKMEVEDEPVPGTSQGTVIEVASCQRDRTAAEVTLQEVDSHVKRCREVLCQLKTSFDSEAQLRANPRVVAWRQELTQIEKKLEFPKTIIAVVGDTGAGKSSLMNAILDHRSVLPTSGMRACTAVVVEVVENTTSNYFEADIEFLQRKEWLDELQVLLRDLTGFDGQVKNRQPDPASDAYVSYCKVKAVYGKIDRFEVLSRFNMVTHWLGKTKVIKSSKPEDFRRQVERYIETQDPGAGGQYWPIVKHVRLRMPKCDVCSSGAALVDLPGVRDSNAARDKIAREYLKNCTAVWVVSSIHRAIDDKTAKDLLGENFRRQLLMDGQYGSIAFICTKTDVIIPSEIIRPLKLEDQIKIHEDRVTLLEEKKNDQQLTMSRCSRQVIELRVTMETLEQEVKELNDNLTEIRCLLDSESADSEQTEEHEALQEYQEEARNKEMEMAENLRKIEELIAEKREAKQKIHELETELTVHRREITAICARARNEYSKKEIRRDFKAGLKEMKRRAGMVDEEEAEEEDESDDDDCDDGVGSTADNLKVFCCSSTEYQKLKNLLTDDGPAQVFSALEDTEIPSLRNYVHEMTSVRRQQALERLIRSLGRFVFDLQSYTTTGNYMHSGDRLGTKSVIESQVQQLDITLAPVLKQLQTDIDIVFDGSIKPKMEEGAGNASMEANNTCAKWGAPVNRDKTKDRRTGGLHWTTYKATVRRQGVYASRTFGAIDMNEELSEPMYRSMTIVWDKAFSGMLWRVLEKLKTEILAKLRAFVDVVCGQLEQLGIPRERSGRVGAQLQGSAANKLTEMVNYLKELITDRQRTISRVVTPIVQERLVYTFNTCAGESGKGMFIRMKTHMDQGIDRQRYTMFDEATNKLMQALVDLQNEIQTYVQGVCQALIADLRVAFEPLWDTQVNSSLLRSAFLKPVTHACANVREIYRIAGLQNTEEKTLVHPKGDNSSNPVIKVASSTTTCTAGAEIGNATVKLENTNDSKRVVVTGGNGECVVRVKTEPAASHIAPQPGTSGSGVSWVQVKQEGQGTLFQRSQPATTVRSCTVGSGAYPSASTSVATKPLVRLLPRQSNAATVQGLNTHNATATGSTVTVPPGVGALVRQVTPAATSQYGIARQGANGMVVIEPVNLLNACGGLVTQTNTQNAKQNIIVVNQQQLSAAGLNNMNSRLQVPGTSRSMSNSPVSFTPQGKENAYQVIQQNSKTKAPTETVTVSGVSVKKEQVDTGYERKRIRPRYCKR